MKFAKPIAFLLLCNGIAAFVPRHQRRQLAPALAARGKSKAKKEAAAARILESPPVAEVATETNVLPLVADVVLEIAQSPLETDVSKHSGSNQELARRGLMQARLAMEVKARAAVSHVASELATEAVPETEVVSVAEETTSPGLVESQLAMETKALKEAAARASKVRQDAISRALLGAQLEYTAKARLADAKRKSQLAMEAEALKEAAARASKVRQDAISRALLGAQLEYTAKARLADAKRKSDLLEAQLAMEEEARILESERLAAIEAKKGDFEAMRVQPKSHDEEAALQAKYGAMEVGERAFNILLDLGYITLSPEPGDADFDGDDFV